MKSIFSSGQNFANWLRYGSRTESMKSHGAISTSWKDITGGARWSAASLSELCSAWIANIPCTSFNPKCVISFRIEVWSTASKPKNISQAHDPWLRRWRNISSIFTHQWSTIMNSKAYMASNASLVPTSSIFIVFAKWPTRFLISNVCYKIMISGDCRITKVTLTSSNNGQTPTVINHHESFGAEAGFFSSIQINNWRWCSSI